jgi:hypothetical protein
MLVRLCLVQDSSPLKKLPLPARLSHLCLYSLVARSIMSLVWRSFFWVRWSLRSRASETLEKADFEGSAVNRVEKSGDHGFSSRGSSQ